MSKSKLHWAAAAAGFALVFGWAASGFAYTYVRSCGPTWTQLPAPYKMNNQGSQDVGASATETILQKSYDAWEKPPASFRVSYNGQTSKTAMDSRQSRNLPPIHSWAETTSEWPSQLGSPSSGVLGVTMTSFNSNCEIVNAPILYNGVSYTFGSGGSADLQSIATHEIGHYLGLDHSSASGATMQARYTGGTAFRTLEQDDIQGLCSLYGPCSCSTDSDCPGSQVCNNQQCEQPPCQSDADCSGVKECNQSTGDCEQPTCNSDSDCTTAGYTCDQSTGTCVPQCEVCKSCQSSSDCPSSQGWGCVPSINSCVRVCSGGGCPGDSKCTTVQTQQGAFDICLNPGACVTDQKTICPSQYVCGEGQVVQNCKITGGDDTGTTSGGDTGTTGGDTGLLDTGGSGDAATTGTGDTSSNACPSLGRKCSSNCAQTCGPQSKGTITTKSGDKICSCPCSSNADCGNGGVCRNYNGQKWCAPTSGVKDAGSDGSLISKPSNSEDGRLYCGTSAPVSPGAPFAALLFALGFLALRRRDR